MKIIFISLLTLVSFIAFTQTTIKVNERRIEERIFELSKFGKDANGRGYRVAFTKGDQVKSLVYRVDEKNRACCIY